MSPSYTGAVLVKFVDPGQSSEEGLGVALRVLAAECLPLAHSVALHRALEGKEAYAYLYSRETGALTSSVLAQVLRRAQSLAAFEKSEIRVERLRPVFDRSGASRGESPRFHYVVETDVPPEHESDLNDWYDQEHMPGLAACPGTVRARRFRNADGSPRHHACYDLVRAETLSTTPWLAVRNTEWSSRIRPHFLNTKRTMFRVLFESEL